MYLDFWTIILDFNNNNFRVLDQKLLPFKEAYIELKNKDDVYRVIKDMNVRGAPLIGIVALVGIYLEVINKSVKDFEDILKLMEYLQNSRATAVNIFNYFSELKGILKNKEFDEYVQIVKNFIVKIVLNEKEKNEKIAKNGLNLIKSIFDNKDKLRILTHCNTGSLATIGLGTALGIIKYIKNYYDIFVWVDETRPYLQGSRLTALELEREGISFSIISDNAAAFLMSNNMVDLVIVGADRVALNGDVANKIGTLNLAVLCYHFKIPFIVALPESSIDKNLQSLTSFKVENRDPKEILTIKCNSTDCYITKDYYSVYNPSFDITPSKYVNYIVTDFEVKVLNEVK
jgi:methylthioribose-1-phosphate isomerase